MPLREAAATSRRSRIPLRYLRPRDVAQYSSYLPTGADPPRISTVLVGCFRSAVRVCASGTSLLSEKSPELLGILVGPVTKLPTPNVLVGERRERLGSKGGR